MNKFQIIRKYMSEKKIDVFLFTSYEIPNPNLFYLTGYQGSGFLIVPLKDKPFLHVPTRDLLEARKVKGIEIIGNRKLSDVLFDKKLNGKIVGIDFTNISASEFSRLKEVFSCEMADVSDFMEDLRSIKSLEEINKIKKACNITDKIIKKFVDKFKSFKTEQDASAFLVYETFRNGCTLAFEPIVASGTNAAIPHHKPKGKINKGFCVVDFGVKYEGYCSDVTRTIYFGKPSKEEEKIYYDLLENQELAISCVRDGFVISELCSSIDRKLKQNLIHALGHGLGIEVHEKPVVSSSSKQTLKEGMVVTIEPGEYVEGKYGIRIEDDVLVTKRGQEVLSKFTKKLIIIK